MAAVPKNKISRVERGKRRAGNTPTLTRDRHSKVPMHKRGFVAELLQFTGMIAAGSAPTAEIKEKSSSKPASDKATEAMKATAATAPRLKPAKAKGQKIRQTQHKG